ncbi:glycosylphosphatidylinositol anchor biosynthesis [Globomyces sp. JEL0801]|nr:glycosylphosphatidylinositol anchor biosynthesis [Globomyces sp. JEL0801]
MPLVAPLLIYCGQSLHMIQKSDIRFNRKGMKAYLTRSLLLLFCTNVLVGIYFNRCHKRGVIQIMKWLRQEAYQGTVTDILFLMPCHSAPFYSYIHLDIPMRYITCEPPLGVQNKTAYRDETDILYQNPESFFRTYFSNQMGSKKLPFSEKGIDPIPVENQTYTIQPYKWPSHLVWYDNPTLAPYLRPLMNGSDYKEVCVLYLMLLVCKVF